MSDDNNNSAYNSNQLNTNIDSVSLLPNIIISNSMNNNDSDDDSYNSDDDYTDDDTPPYIVCREQEYDPEENSRTKFTIVFCNEYLHNPLCPEDDAIVGGHFITYGRLKQLNIAYIRYLQMGSADIYTARLEIAQCIDLPSGYRVSIIKTIWLKIIQRAWKKIYAIRKSVIQSRMHMQALLYKQLNGKWPQHCDYLPGLRSMLHHRF